MMDYRIIEESDFLFLIQYFEGLSETTKSFYRPHAFDESTLQSICQGQYPDCQAFIANHDEKIVGYTVIKNGYSDGEWYRFPNYSIPIDPEHQYLLAPSITDAYQSKGIGSGMLSFIEDHLKDLDATHLILWGGVQTRNQQAIRFYQKNDFIQLGEFHHEGLDNWDMVKTLY